MRPDHRMVAHTGFLTHARLLTSRPSRGRELARLASSSRDRCRRGRRRLPPRLRAPASCRGLGSSLGLGRRASASCRAIVRTRSAAPPPTTGSRRARCFVVRRWRPSARRSACRRRTSLHRGVADARPAAARSTGSPARSPASLGVLRAGVAARSRRSPTSPGWPAQQAADSRFVACHRRVAPAARHHRGPCGACVGDAPFPRCSMPLAPAPTLGPPPAASASTAATASACARSTVKVEGQRLRPDPGGQRLRRRRRTSSSPTPTSSPARRDTTRRAIRRARPSDATVVAFDPIRDLAVLRVAGLERPPLAARRRGASATVARSSATPAAARCGSRRSRIAEQIVAIGTDIYAPRPSRPRRVRPRRRAAPGRLRRPAGRPDGRGDRRGVRHRPRPSRDVAYALTDEELAPCSPRRRSPRVGTGDCLRLNVELDEAAAQAATEARGRDPPGSGRRTSGPGAVARCAADRSARRRWTVSRPR